MDKSAEAAKVFNKLASLYQEKYMDVSQYAEGLEIFCNTLPSPSPRILELACGPGNVTRFLLDKKPTLKITGTDLSENMVALAKINNPEGDFFVMDCRNLKELSGPYEGVVCAFAFPYLTKEEVEQLIFDISGILSVGGCFYLSTMIGKYEDSGPRKGSTGDEIFMHFHESDHIENELQKNNFTIINKWEQPYESLSNPATDLIVIAQKRDDHLKSK